MSRARRIIGCALVSALALGSFVHQSAEGTRAVSVNGERRVNTAQGHRKRAALARVTVETLVEREPRLRASAAASLVPLRVLRLATWTVKGRVVGLDGEPFSGRVIADPTSVLHSAVTDAAGRFELRLPARPGHLHCIARDLVTVSAPRVRPDREALVVVAPQVQGSICVTNAATGERLSSVRITLVPTSQLESALCDIAGAGAPLPASWTSSTTTNEQGLADVAAAGALWARLRLTRPGFESLEVPLDAAAGFAQAVALVPNAPERPIVGVVRDSAGVPVAGASLTLGTASSRSDASGSFSIARAEGRIHAYHPGKGCASAETSAQQDQIVELTLRGQAAVETVTLLDAEGVPLGGVRVVPLTSLGAADVFAVHWRTAQSGVDGTLNLPPGWRRGPLAVVGKDGRDIGRVAIEGASAPLLQSGIRVARLVPH